MVLYIISFESKMKDQFSRTIIPVHNGKFELPGNNLSANYYTKLDNRNEDDIVASEKKLDCMYR